MAIWELTRYLRVNRVPLVHSFDFYSNFMGVLAGRLARVPAVIASQRDLGNLRPRFQQRIHRALLRLADYLLVNSEAVAETVRLHWGKTPGRIAVIPNGVDTVRFAPLSSRERGSDSIVVGTLANLRPEKGIEHLVEAAAMVHERYPTVGFIVWGDGPLRGDLEKVVQRLGLDGVVRLAGATAEPEAALRQLDIFVLPSLSEACSNVLLEAMAIGLPVVATGVGSNPFLVEDEASGLLMPPGDAPALAKAIARLFEDPERAATLGARGRERACAMFAMDRMVTRVEALYDRALAGRGR